MAVSRPVAVGQDVLSSSPGSRLNVACLPDPDEVDDSSDGRTPDTVVQFSDSVTDFSSQYGSDGSVCYAASNLAGEPGVHVYGDSPWAFVLRTFGPWWELAPSASRRFKEQAHHKYQSQDFVELTFEQEVYPVQLEIFETYNPGAVVRILAWNGTTHRWEVLWCAKQLECGLSARSRVFSPPLNKLRFPTDTIRLEFYHRHLEYYTELDAVRMTGTVVPSACHRVVLSPAKILRTCPAAHVAGLNTVCSRLENLMFSVRPPSSVVLSCRAVRANHFEKLPPEVIHLIASYLDLPSLCRFACTCRALRTLCYDPLLYSELDLKPYWYKVTEGALAGLTNRCHSVQHLRLSWCARHDGPFLSAVTKFVSVCGKHLVSLHLASCRFVNSEFLAVLTVVAPQLEDLDLQNCCQPYVDDLEFRQIAHFVRLKRLNLYRTAIDLLSVLLILRCCRSLEFLNLGACSAVGNFDEVAFEIAHSCGSLKGLNLWRAKSLTAVGVTTLANGCPLLEELDLGWCLEVYCNTGCIVDLAEKCPHLRKLSLAALRSVCDADVLSLATYCPKLEQLDIFGTSEVGPASCAQLLTSCSCLRFVDVSFCDQIDFVTVQLWRRSFPHVHIVKSVQSELFIT